MAGLKRAIEPNRHRRQHISSMRPSPRLHENGAFRLALCDIVEAFSYWLACLTDFRIPRRRLELSWSCPGAGGRAGQWCMGALRIQWGLPKSSFACACTPPDSEGIL